MGLALSIFGRIAEETPRHVVVLNTPSYQIRRYEPSVAVLCDYAKGWGMSSDGTPFGSLARYIGVSAARIFGSPVPISSSVP